MATNRPKMDSPIWLVLLIYITVNHLPCPVQSLIDSKSHLVKVTTTIMIENDGNTPINHYLIDCDERNGHSKLSHIVAKLQSDPMPVNKTDDGKMWRIDLSAKPIDPGVTIPLIVTKVFTHLELVPSHDVYLMPYSSIQYQVRIIKQGRPQKIKVPSEQYYLVVDDKSLVDLDVSTSTALALEREGTTKIRFVDKSVISDEDFIQPDSIIHIVPPSYMKMYVTPGDSWSLQKYTDYTIEIRVFDADKHQIYPSDDLIIQLSAGNELVITNSTTNGTIHTVHTLNSGRSKIVARLLGTTPAMYSYEKSPIEVELTQELNIYDPLDISPTAVVLPWLPELKPSYQVSIYASGGTGSYLWTTNNSALVDISYTGDDSSVAKITTSGEGTAFVQCIDEKSSVFLRHSMVVVSRIVELSVLPSITETEVGGDIMLPIAVYANVSSLLDLHLPKDQKRESGLVLFHDCSKIKFSVTIVEKTRFTHDSSGTFPNIKPKSCTSLKFTCTQPGSSRVWISYSDPSDPSSEAIKTTTVIACYKPLRPVYPSDVGVLAMHTSVELAFEGGPRPFGGRLDDHYTRLEPTGDSVVNFEPIIDRYRYNKDLHVFRAYCNRYGEVTLALSVGNQPSPTLPNPASSTSSMKIICAKPDSIQLKPGLKESCPLNKLGALVDTIVPLSTSIATDFELVVLDELKRQFLNISSFNIKWTMNGQGTISSKTTEEINAVAGFRRLTRSYITVQPNGKEGQGRLQADLNQYKNEGLYRGQTLDLSANLDFQFVDFARINPNRTIIYNHERNVVVLSIVKGSGYFCVESLQGAKLANVSYVSVLGQHRINITPLKVGKFAVRLEDQCIESSLGAPILSEVNIVDDAEFSREVLKPGRSLRYCKDVDSSLFCVYLSVDLTKVFHSQSQTSTRAPTTSAPLTLSTPVNKAKISPAPTTQAPSVRTQTAETPSPVSSTHNVESSTPSPTPEAQAKSSDSPIQRVMGYLLFIAVTCAAVTISYKWWQDKNKKPSDPQFITDSSFLRHSTSAASGNSVRFSPSTSRGPASSTPKTRTLYTERLFN